jgi:ribosomal protein S27E
MWNGETWLCENERCNFVNAAIRTRCRNCKAPHPGPMHPDAEINAAIQQEMQENAAHDARLGLR